MIGSAILLGIAAALSAITGIADGLWTLIVLVVALAVWAVLTRAFVVGRL